MLSLKYCLHYLIFVYVLINSPVSSKNPRYPTTPDRNWTLKPIGKVISPYINKLGTPKQATILNEGSLKEGEIHIFPGYEECIHDLDGFDYIWVISIMHLNQGFKTKITTRPNSSSMIAQPVGLFSSRAPHRPNPIALSALKLTKIDTNLGIIYVNGLDLLDETPILDIKPYVPAFDSFPGAKAGWMDDINHDPLSARNNGYQSFPYIPKKL